MADPLKSTGFNLNVESLAPVTLQDRFGVPPFSVLDAKQGYWQSRKKAWLKLGIQSEIGRGDNLLKFSEQANISIGNRPAPPKIYEHQKKGRRRTRYAECLRTGIGEEYGRKEMNATSIFDPVLCELIYRWFCPPNGRVLDPFAGGSVRGIVAAMLEKKYTGVDLREEQVEANRQQWKIIGSRPYAKDKPRPFWFVSDAKETKSITGIKPNFDLIFSCPPYGNLEVYSDDPRDISTLEYNEFCDAYYEIIKTNCQLLKENRFACFIVGDFRDKNGIYHAFPTDTILAFEEAGLHLYNEAILVTVIGSLPVRVNNMFMKGRKLGKTHQNILIFYKGDDPKDIRSDFPEEV